MKLYYSPLLAVFSNYVFSQSMLAQSLKRVGAIQIDGRTFAVYEGQIAVRKIIPLLVQDACNCPYLW